MSSRGLERDGGIYWLQSRNAWESPLLLFDAQEAPEREDCKCPKLSEDWTMLKAGRHCPAIPAWPQKLYSCVSPAASNHSHAENRGVQNNCSKQCRQARDGARISPHNFKQRFKYLLLFLFLLCIWDLGFVLQSATTCWGSRWAGGTSHKISAQYDVHPLVNASQPGEVSYF